MAFERIMGLYVTDQAEYQLYRNGMTPLLKEYGGYFAFDFSVDEVLQSRGGEKINRVFVLEFPSEEVMHQYFSDERYLAVKGQHFEKSVGSVTTISLHEKSN